MSRASAVRDETEGTPLRATEEIRCAVRAMNREVDLLVQLERSAVANGTTLDGLVARWGRITQLLDVGPIPRSTKCPHCGRVGEPEALHCWTCWEELVPVASAGRQDELRSR